MPRSKKAAQRGRGRGAHNSIERRTASIASSFVPRLDIGASQKNHGHSLHPGPFNMQRDPSWDSGQKLRHTKVIFVSAGDSEGLDEKEPETGLAHMTLDGTSEQVQLKERGKITEIGTSQDDEHSGHIGDAKSLYFIDTRGSEPVTTGLRAQQIIPTSPTPSSSSDEVIVFAGRDRAGKGLSKALKPKYKSNTAYNSQIENTDDKIWEDQILLTMKADQTEHLSMAQQAMVDNRHGFQGHKLAEVFSQTYQQPVLPISETEFTRESSYRSGRGWHDRKVKREYEQALTNDYISNMEAEDLDPGFSFEQRGLSSTFLDDSQESEMSLDDSPPVSSSKEQDHLNLSSFPAISTSNRKFKSIQAVLSKRNGKCGQQYLVVRGNDTGGEVCWVSSSSLTDVCSVKIIADFEKKENLPSKMCEGEDDTDSSTDKDSTCHEGHEALNDDAGFLQRKIDRLTDEEIARLLSKQEELGMGSSELVLFNNLPETDLNEGYALGHHTLKPAHPAFRQPRNASQAKGSFPAASRLADAYGGFDVMDFERPSLKKRSKGHKSWSMFDLSDSEFESAMAMTWDKDRLRKREKKEEREALRAKGLLGKDPKPDLKNRFKEGMGISAVKSRIKSFLISDDTTLNLPPMDKADRQVVHGLANAFNLKSKSAGNGSKRYPVLYRTTRTIPFSETRFDAVEVRLTRRFLPGKDLKGRNSVSIPKRSGRGGASNAAVTYRDGDIVGGSAPELGIENKGRAMLEKMGWSTGTALGAINNKGILQPVSHVVKTTKAGLG